MMPKQVLTENRDPLAYDISIADPSSSKNSNPTFRIESADNRTTPTINPQVDKFPASRDCMNELVSVAEENNSR
jgi:hypothetical protein